MQEWAWASISSYFEATPLSIYGRDFRTGEVWRGRKTSGSPPLWLQSDANETGGVFGREADNSRCGRRQEDLLWNNGWIPGYFRLPKKPDFFCCGWGGVWGERVALVRRSLMEAERGGRGGCVPSRDESRLRWFCKAWKVAVKETGRRRGKLDPPWLIHLAAPETLPVNNTYCSNNLYTVFVVLLLHSSISHVCTIDRLIDLAKIMRILVPFTLAHLWLWKKRGLKILSIQDANLANVTKICPGEDKNVAYILSIWCLIIFKLQELT